MSIKQKISLFLAWSTLLMTKIVQAQHLIDPEKDGDKYTEGTYKLNDFIVLVVNASTLILRFVGSLALLFFIYGGLTLLISAGNTEQVNKAKGIIKAAVIGLIIVFASFIIIRFALQAFGIDNWDGSFIN